MNNNYSQSYNSIFLKKYKELEKLETNEPNKYNYLLKISFLLYMSYILDIVYKS